MKRIIHMFKRQSALFLALLLMLGCAFPSVVLSEDEAPVPLDLPEEGDEGENGEITNIRPLTVGDEGDDVLFLQLRLESLQYFSGEPDGWYTGETQDAVRRFQEDNASKGLEPTGDADPETQLLLSSARYRGLKYGSEGDDVREVQTRLTALGYYKGKISGNYLEGTTNGIKKFQELNGLEVTGAADPLTQEILFSATAVGRYDTEETTPTPTPLSDDAFYRVNENDDGAPMQAGLVPYSKTLKSGTQGSALVKQLQERMQLLGYYDGPISGNFMEKTLKAVKKIQKQNGLTVTGTVDEETWNLIFNDPDLVMPNATPRPTATPEPVAFAITVDVRNQIVSVYTRDEDGNYTVPVRQMLCSTGKVGTDSPLGDWVLNGRKALWCYFPKWGDYARYWTRINAQVAFHSPIYSAVSLSAMKTTSYKMLGRRASHGCIRLSVPDAKWIYDNVGKGTVVSIRNDLPIDEELKAALKLPASPNETPTPAPPEPDYSREQKPDLKGRTLAKGNKNDSDAVYWVQRRLKELGYYTTRCTGQMLNRTTQAVKDFQKAHGFSQTGRVDQKMIDAMAEAED